MSQSPESSDLPQPAPWQPQDISENGSSDRQSLSNSSHSGIMRSVTNSNEDDTDNQNIFSYYYNKRESKEDSGSSLSDQEIVTQSSAVESARGNCPVAKLGLPGQVGNDTNWPPCIDNLGKGKFFTESNDDLCQIDDQMIGEEHDQTQTMSKKVSVFEHTSNQLEVEDNEQRSPLKATSSAKTVGMSKEEKRTIELLRIKRKQKNHNLLKKWNYTRVQGLQFHLSILNKLLWKIDEKIKQSLSHFSVYRQFFVEREEQESRYLNHKVTTLKPLINNQISKTVYMNCSSILSSVHKQGKLRQNKAIEEFLEVVREQIIRKVFDCYEAQQTNKNLVSLREQISIVRENIEKVNQQVSDKVIAVEKSLINGTGELHNDFYLHELSFLRKCQTEMRLQSYYGAMLLQLNELSRQEEKRRTEVIKQGLMIYSQASNKLTNQTKPTHNSWEMNSIEQLSKQEEDKLIDEHYLLEDLLEDELITQIKSRVLSSSTSAGSPGQSTPPCQQLSLQQFTVFITSYPIKLIPPFSCSDLLQKQFAIKVVACESLQLPEGQTVAGRILMTVDKFVNIQLSNCSKLSNKIKSAYGKPIFSSQAEFIDVQSGPSGTDFIRVKTLRKKGLFNYLLSKGDSCCQVEFESSQDRQSFSDYLDSLSQ